jgi:catechol 2,3-dioxygenase-like lactoylglutathione lyase family enzyme
MNRYSSLVTFLYYSDYEKAKSFYSDILQLELVMDQGFATVYKITDSSFVGCVKKQEGSIDSSNKGGTLISLTVPNSEELYKEFKTYNLPYLSDLKVIERIPLKSFFFKDYEGYDFEIQEFIKKEDKELF